MKKEGVGWVDGLARLADSQPLDKKRGVICKCGHIMPACIHVLETVKCKKCGKIIVEAKELIRIIPSEHK